jgi:hypothetical protein
MEPVKYQLSKCEFIVVTAIRFWCRKGIILAQMTLLVMAVACWFLEPPPNSFAIFLTVCFVFLPIASLRRLSILVKSNPGLFVSEVSLNADSNGIKVNSAVASSSLNWSAFKKWTENSKYIFVLLGDFQALTIPKRAFTNEQLTEFKTLLSDKIRSS